MYYENITVDIAENNLPRAVSPRFAYTTGGR